MNSGDNRGKIMSYIKILFINIYHEFRPTSEIGRKIIRTVFPERMWKLNGTYEWIS